MSAAEQVDFTEPYFDADQSLLVLTENAETYATLDDLAGTTIGVQSRPPAPPTPKENLPEGATIKEFQTGDELFPAPDLRRHRSSGAPGSAGERLPGDAGSEQFMVTETFPTGEQYGFAVAKDNDGAARGPRRCAGLHQGRRHPTTPRTPTGSASRTERDTGDRDRDGATPSRSAPTGRGLSRPPEAAAAAAGRSTASTLALLACIALRPTGRSSRRRSSIRRSSADLFPEIITVAAKNTIILAFLAFTGGIRRWGWPLALMRLVLDPPVPVGGARRTSSSSAASPRC